MSFAIDPTDTLAAQSALSALPTVLTPDNYATPPAQLTATVGTTSPPSEGGGSTQLFGLVIDTTSTLAIASILRSMSAVFAGAVTGRTAELYLLTPNGSGGCTPFFASGLLAAPSAGTLTYTPPSPQSVRAPAGTVLGVWSSDTSSTQAESLLVSQSTGAAIYAILWGPSQGRLSVGTTYVPSGGLFAQSVYIPALEATFASEATVVATRWANQPNGWLRLDPDGLADPAQLPTTPLPNLPAPYQGSAPTSLALGGTESLVFDPSLLSTKNVVTPPNGMSVQQQAPAGGGAGGGLSGSVIGSYNTAGGNGFSEAGILTRLRYPAYAISGSDPVIQAWIIRPTATPTSSGVFTFTLVATLGQVSRVDAVSPVEFAGLAVAVQVGDIPVVRGINTTVEWYSAASAYANDYGFYLTPSDMTLAALNGGGTTTSLGNVRVLWYAEIQPLAYVLSSASRTFDAFGNLPANVARPVDNPWAGKKLIAVGTSITASNPTSGGGSVSILTGSGYIAQALRNLCSNGINNGVGSSGIVWDGTRVLSLSAKSAELVAAFGGANGQWSYQVLLTGLSADLVVFDHGYNDRSYATGNLFYAAGDLNEDGTAATVGNLNINRKNFYGAANYLRSAIKADRPTCRWVWVTPISLFNPGTGSGPPDSLTLGWTNTNTIRTAILALAAWWNDPLLDWSHDFELNYDGCQPDMQGGVTPTFLGAYNPATAYVQNNQVVTADGRSWIALSATTGNAPPTAYGTTSNTWWAQSGHTLDGVHPDQSVHDRAARTLYRFLLRV